LFSNFLVEYVLNLPGTLEEEFIKNFLVFNTLLYANRDYEDIIL